MTAQVMLAVELSDAQAWNLAQLFKRMGFSDFRAKAQDDAEGHDMQEAAGQVAQALVMSGTYSSMKPEGHYQTRLPRLRLIMPRAARPTPNSDSVAGSGTPDGGFSGRVPDKPVTSTPSTA